ncbi:MAG: U32 family peptidase [Bacilli bacterium]|nr:U32 family peptidase [Bacilli bacterium]
MNKISVIIKSIAEAKDIKDMVDAYLIPIEDLSINYQKTFTIEEIEEIKKLKKEVFVFINKNIHNNELEKLEETLKNIEKLNINGIIFYDISLIELKKELNLKTDLVWHQEHLTTNYVAANYYYDKGVKYTYLSSELTKREIEEIKEKYKGKTFVNVFGYLPMFTSRRRLVNNYVDTFNLKEKGNRIYKEEKYYYIDDNKKGTTVYSDYILNVKEEIKADYIVFNSNMIDEDTFKEILKDYKNNKLEKETGFLFKETIYKVK